MECESRIPRCLWPKHNITWFFAIGDPYQSCIWITSAYESWFPRFLEWSNLTCAYFQTCGEKPPSSEFWTLLLWFYFQKLMASLFLLFKFWALWPPPKGFCRGYRQWDATHDVDYSILWIFLISSIRAIQRITGCKEVCGQNWCEGDESCFSFWRMNFNCRGDHKTSWCVLRSILPWINDWSRI